MSRKSFLMASVVCLAAVTAGADPLKVVSVNPLSFSTVFDPSGLIVVQDSVSTFALEGATGLARLRTRTTLGQPGAPAAGQYMYAYHLSLQDVRAIGVIECIETLTVNFRTVTTLDYNADGVADEQVFVVRGGDIPSNTGPSAPSHVDKTGSSVTFRWGGRLCSGAGGIAGETSFFFGVTSPHAPTFVAASVQQSVEPPQFVVVRAPQTFIPVPNDWIGFFLPSPGDPEAVRAELRIATTRERRFGGTIVIDDPLLGRATTFDVDGTLSASGQLTMVGAGAGGRLVAHGVETPTGAGGVLDARVRLTLGGGRVLEGTLLLVQAVPPMDPPQVISDWKLPAGGARGPG